MEMGNGVNTAVLADVWYPAAGKRIALRPVLLVAAGALAIALAAQVALYLPFTPVPVTLQTLAVLLAGMVLGSRRGVLAVGTYIAAGAMGGGPAWLLGPTGGYLAGFIAAAFITGLLAERGWGRSWWAATAAMAVGNIAIYLCGMSWLALVTGPAAAFTLGAMPFIAADAAKIAVAGLLLPTVHRLAVRG